MTIPDAHKNFAYSTVATAPSPADSGTSLVVAAGEGGRFPTAPFNAVVWPVGAKPTPANAEIVRVTAISTDTFTITRAQEATTARSIVAGDQIAAAVTAKTLTDAESPDHEYDYAQITAPVTISATTVGTANTIITGAAITYDGATRVCIEVFAPYIQPGAGTGSFIQTQLFDGSSSIGIIGLHGRGGTGGQPYRPHYSRTYLTPSAGSHTYSIRGYRSVNDGVWGAGAGGSDVYLPSYMRISRAG